MGVLEVVVFLVAVFGLYWLLRPLQRRLERKLYNFFRAKTHVKGHRVIDITDSLKRENSDDKRKL
jgi:hypothetical protein